MTTATASPFVDRLARLREKLAQQQLDALLVSQPENRRYLSGFTGSAGWLLISAEHALFATDFRYYEQVGLECPDFELVRLTTGLKDALPDMIGRVAARRVGFEADHATYANVQEWHEAVTTCEWVPTRGLIAPLRAVKDAAELAAVRAAVALTDEALASVLPQIRPGMTELDVAWRIESAMRTHGAEGVAFELIVAGGPNAARPHARAGQRPLQAGEPIVIDIGARVGGYCADLTRTVCLGRPTDEARFWEVYNTVLAAQTAAEAAIRPGMTGKEGDAVARDLHEDSVLRDALPGARPVEAAAGCAAGDGGEGEGVAGRSRLSEWLQDYRGLDADSLQSGDVDHRAKLLEEGWRRSRD